MSDTGASAMGGQPVPEPVYVEPPQVVPACGTCRWYTSASTHARIGVKADDPTAQPPPPDGYCQRYPPTVFQSGSIVTQQWPIVNDDDWCGEYGPQ